MADYVGFFLNSKSSVVGLETLEISHPSFSKVYYIVRNAVNGILAYDENGNLIRYEYYPLSISMDGVKNDLDSGLKVSLGDLGEIIPEEIDRLIASDTFDIKPTVKYRSYRSDDLSSPMFGPLVYEIPAFSFDGENSSFEATAPRLNSTKTGIIYDISGAFRTLRGYL